MTINSYYNVKDYNGLIHCILLSFSEVHVCLEKRILELEVVELMIEL